jgi:GTPase
MKTGKVVIVGRPNTGKSTLLNALMKQKVSITSPRPQTTRKSVRVEYKDERGRIVFSDTPGLMGKVVDLAGKRINLEVPKEMASADLILYLLDISRKRGDEENKLIGLLRKIKAPVILVYNKIDLAKGKKNFLAHYEFLEEEFGEGIKISAKQETHLKTLLEVIFEKLPEGEVKDEVKDSPILSQNAKEFVAELIREKAFLNLRQEVPYSVGVEVQEIRDKKGVMLIKAKILTSADRYKIMVVGRGGRMIKQIGYETRKELELLRNKKVYLELEVETDKHWSERLLT